MDSVEKKDIYEIIEGRYSVRSFRDDPIPDDILKRILNAARMAPSAHNSQEYKFIVVKDTATKKALAKVASEQRFIADAPIIIAAVALNLEDIMENEVPAYAVDLAVAIDHLTLAAVAEDLGTCWVGAFSQKEVRDILKIPPKYKVVVLLPLGVPRDEPGVKSRKKLKDLICEEEFSESSEPKE